jgi:hypothetical protein
MKLKSILIFAAILSLFGNTIAQTAAGFSADNLFSIQRQSQNDNFLNAILRNTKSKSDGNLLPNGAGTFNSFGESNLLLIKTR